LVERLRLAIDHAKVAQHVAHAMPGNLQAAARQAVAAAELAGHGDDAACLGGRGQRPAAIDLAVHDMQRGAESPRQRHGPLDHARIVEQVRHGAREAVERPPAGVEVDIDVAQRQQHFRHIVRQHRRETAAAIARKGPVEIEAVDRREPSADAGGRQMQRRNHDQAALDLLGLDLAHEIEQRHLALIFVAMDAGREHQRRTATVLHDRDRNRHDTPGGIVMGLGHAQLGHLLAVTLEVGIGDDTRSSLLGGHAGTFPANGHCSRLASA
jgi:hypothetical protein